MTSFRSQWQFSVAVPITFGVKFKQAETLAEAYKLQKSNKIKIDGSHMDSGPFTKETIETVEANCKRFYIRAQCCGELSDQVKQVKSWETRAYWTL